MKRKRVRSALGHERPSRSYRLTSSIVDRGDNLDHPATVLAGFNVEVEHALEALRPAYGGAALGGCFGCVGAGRFAATACRRDRCAVWTVRGEHAVVADEVDTGFGDECRETGHQVERV